MKVILSLIVCIMFISSCGQAQNNAADKQITEMLKEFYTKYNTMWSTTHISTSVPADVLNKKLDSLMAKYCTPKLRKEANEWLEGGHDLLINDQYTDTTYIKTLTVIKDSTKTNEYVVSYTLHDIDPYGKEYTQQVTLHVTVVKEQDGYKIDAVK